MNEQLDSRLKELALTLEEQDGSQQSGQDFCGFREQAEQMTDLFITALFPRHAARCDAREDSLRAGACALQTCLGAVLQTPEQGEQALLALLDALPEIKRQLDTDLRAAYRGDPAARSLDEILICYPAFRAIATYRLAHILYLCRVPLLPRVMTEYAHRLTGIDIHPGAAIGEAFFIDHGTGVVIGETTVIGRDVKLYQHVTLGAKSFEAGEDGTLVKGIRRHPHIGDRVVVYAGATILGGSTHIGSDCVIGGSVWLTHSVPAGKMVLARAAVTDTPLTRDLIPDPEFESAML